MKKEKKSKDKQDCGDRLKVIYNRILINIKLYIEAFNNLAVEITKFRIIFNLNYDNSLYQTEYFKDFFSKTSYLLENTYYCKSCLKEIKEYFLKNKSNLTLENIVEFLNIIDDFQKIFMEINIEVSIYYKLSIYYNSIDNINYYPKKSDSSIYFKYKEETEEKMILLRNKYKN